MKGKCTLRMHKITVYNFPMDHHFLPFTMRLPRTSDKHCRLEFDVTELELEKMSLPSWRLHRPMNLQADHANDSKKETKIVSISLIASREYHRYLNYFALTFSFGTAALYSYSVPCNLVAERGSITFLLLLTIITYYFQLMDELPKVPHETYGLSVLSSARTSPHASPDAHHMS